jgi:transposase
MIAYVGVDIHKRFSQVHVQSQEGSTIARRRLEHDDLDSLRAFFSDLPGEVHVAVEATMGWMWLADELEALGCCVHLTNQKKARAISESHLKTDSVDAETLCQLLRTGFLPEAYLPSPHVRDLRMLLRFRMALVEMKVRVKNAVHAILVRYNVLHGYSDLFGLAGRQFLADLALPDAGRHCLKGWMELLEFLEGQLKDAERALYARCQKDQRVEWLESIPGVGRLTAHLILAEIGEVEHFRSPKKLVCYAGLAPRVHQSASSFHTGHIGPGRKYLKWGLVEAARTASYKDPALARFYERLKRRKGSAKAIVAVAAKLAHILWHVLTERRPYRPGNIQHPGSARTTNGRPRKATARLS